MTFKIVVVDDEDVSDLIDNIRFEGSSFLRVTPTDFKSDIASITDEYDLVLMDHKLAGNIGKIPYMGTTLIQELRNRMAQSELSPKPIILWSIAGNIDSYQQEKASHNLVDAVWKKEWLHNDNKLKCEEFSKKLVSLISGYQVINSLVSDYRSGLAGKDSRLISGIFGTDDDRAEELVPEPVIGHLKNSNNQLVHHVSIFLTNAILRFNGFLIDEATLAARTGADINHEQWSDFRDHCFSTIKYEGVFSDFFDRWWAFDFESWWLNNISDDHPAGLTASERVSLINDKFSTKLQPALPSNKHSETMFWHCCVINNVPLDELDSFKVTSSERREWQDQFYACYSAIDEKKHKAFGFELVSRDKERFLSIRREGRHE